MKALQLIKMTFFVILLSPYFASCSNDPIVPEVTVEPNMENYFTKNLDFDSSAGEKTFSFNSNVEWAISVAHTMSGEAWCTVTPSSGKEGNNTIKIKVLENTGYDNRTTTLNFIAESIQKSINVNQSQKNAVLLKKRSYEIKGEGEEIEIEVQANIDYSLDIPDNAKEWILENKSRGLSSYKHILKISANETYENRFAELIISTENNISDTLKIKQYPKEIYGKLISGKEFRDALYCLANNVDNAPLYENDNKIHSIVIQTEINNPPMQKHVIVSTEESVAPVYAVWNQQESTIQLQTSGKGILANENSKSMFVRMAELRNVDIKGIEMKFVQDMSTMFSGCSNISNIDFSSINTNNVIDMSGMFQNCHNLKSLDLNKFETSKVLDMRNMFTNCNGLETLLIDNFDTSNVTNMYAMFYGCESLRSLNVTNFDTRNVTDMAFMFELCRTLTSLNLNNFNTSKVEQMYHMFYFCEALELLQIDNFDTSKVTTMMSMFAGISVSLLNLSSFDTSNVTDMTQMFYGCSNIESLNLSNFNTSKVISMMNMFYGLNVSILDLSSFDTSNVTDMSHMFQQCHNLKEIKLKNFNTSKVTDMSHMFNDCISLKTIDLSSFDSKNLISMNGMFKWCMNLESINLSSFDTSSVESMNELFYSCYYLSSINLGKNFSIPTVSDNMFKNLAYGVGECKIICSQDTKDKLMDKIGETKANIVFQ